MLIFRDRIVYFICNLLTFYVLYQIYQNTGTTTKGAALPFVVFPDIRKKQQLNTSRYSYIQQWLLITETKYYIVRTAAVVGLLYRKVCKRWAGTRRNNNAKGTESKGAHQ